MNGESPMSDPREALVAREVRTSDGRSLTPAQVAAHDGIQRRLTWPSMHWGVEGVHPDAWPHIAMAAADAILAEFDVTELGEGMTIQIGGSRAGKTQALAERVADEVMKRGGSATVTSLPSVEDVARALFDAEYHDIDAPERDAEWRLVTATDGAQQHGTPWHHQARAVLALLPGRTEAEVKAEALREAAQFLRNDMDEPWGDRAANRLDVRADAIEKEADRG